MSTRRKNPSRTASSKNRAAATKAPANAVLRDWQARTGAAFDPQAPARLLVGAVPGGVGVHTTLEDSEQTYFLSPPAATVLAAAVRELAGVAYSAGFAASLGGTHIGIPGPVALPTDCVVRDEVLTPGGDLALQVVPARDGTFRVGLGSPVVSVDEDDAWDLADALDQAATTADPSVGPWTVRAAV